MYSFIKIFRIQLFSKILYMGMLPCFSLKFSICDISVFSICDIYIYIYIYIYIHIYMFLRNSYALSYTNFIHILSKFYPVRSFDCR